MSDLISRSALLEEFKMNPNIKFDYQNYFVDDEPTRDIGKIQEKTIPVDRQPTGEYKPIRPSDYEDDYENEYQNEIPRKVASTPERTKVDNSKTAKKNFTVILGVVFAFLLILAIVLGIFIKNGTLILGGKRVEVASFIGADYIEEIVNNPEYEDYIFEVVYVSSSDFAEGTVPDQDPKAGDSLAKGGVVKLYVAKSGEGKIIPDFTNYNYKAARDTLESMGFVVTLQATENTAVQVGNVISTNPAANTSVLEGSTITVYYAVDTSAETQFKMPDLEGLSLEEAKLLIERNELVVSKIETVDSSIASNYVVSQSPADGSPVRKGDSVIITISSGYVSSEISIKLPANVGVLSVRATVDGSETFNQLIDTDSYSTYAVSVKGNTSKSEIKIYIDNCLYYEAIGDFTKDNVKFSNANTYVVAFYKNVVGMSELYAITALNNLGYRSIQINRETSSQPEGTVIAQSPSFESAPHVDTSTTIVLTVSKGMGEETSSGDNSVNDLEGVN